jgi:hypothetical protein
MTPPREPAARDEAEPAACDEAELELDVAARRLGIEIPADLAGGVLHGYRGLRDMTDLLRRAESREADQAAGQARGEPDA